MTAPTPPSKAQDLADALFASDEPMRISIDALLFEREDLRALAEAAYRLGQHDGWNHGCADAKWNSSMSEDDNPYGGDDE